MEKKDENEGIYYLKEVEIKMQIWDIEGTKN